MILAAIVIGLSLVTPAPAPGAGSEGLSGSLTSTTLASRESGVATWYCCTRGYGRNDLVAAIDRAQSQYDTGDVVTVTSREVSVTVTIVDVCGCPGNRIIDLHPGAFARLAPLSRGIVNVTVEGTIPLPETDR